MKKMMIVAYTEYNLGDDLFIKILCERYPQTEFAIVAHSKYRQTFKDLKNLTIYPSTSFTLRVMNYLFRQIKVHDFLPRYLIKRCDGVVHIGGSIFMQPEGWEKFYNKPKALHSPSKSYFLLGANFGPFTNPDYYRKHKEMFSQYTDICFREEYTYGMFNDLGNVRLAPDIVFQLQQPAPVEHQRSIAISVIKPSFRPNLQKYDQLYYEKLKDIAVYFIQRGYPVDFMSFCEHEGDQEAIEQIIQLMPAEYVSQTRSHYYSTNMEELTNIIAQSSLVVATRFHSMILAWAFNKPVVPIAYSDKMTNVMKDTGFTGLYTDFQQLEELQPEQVYECLEAEVTDVSEQRKGAEKHFLKLDAYLKKV